jgi:hypothetical protein
MDGEQEQPAMTEILLPQQDDDKHDTPRNNSPPAQHQTNKRRFPICLHQVQMEVRYDPFRHVNGAARFLAEQQWQRQKQDRHNNEGVVATTTATTPTNNSNYHLVTFLTIRGKSQLALWVMVLMQLVVVDMYWLLPTGVILYAVSLQIAWEQWMNEILENQRYQQQQRLELQQQQRKRELKLQVAIQRAEFEYHVLQDRGDIEIVPVYEPDIGRTIVYAVPPSKTLHLPFPSSGYQR